MLGRPEVRESRDLLEAMPGDTRQDPYPAVHGRHSKATEEVPRSSEGDEGWWQLDTYKRLPDK